MSLNKIQAAGILIFCLTLAGAGCSNQRNFSADNASGQSSPTSAINAEITVKDQQVEQDKVLVSKMAMPASGWVVINNYQNGIVGGVIGYSPATQESNFNVTVIVDQSQITPSLIATLYSDGGQLGVFDNKDKPFENASGTVRTLFSSRGTPSPVQIKSKPAN